MILTAIAVCAALICLILITILMIHASYPTSRFRFDIKDINRRYGWEKEKNRKRILQKFEDHLFVLIGLHQIYLSQFESYESLNADRLSLVSNASPGSAAGCYIHFKKECDSPLKRRINKMPKIYVVKNKNEFDNLWVLAHELGHHFAITLHDDHSEEGADNYIMTLAQERLTKFEVACIGGPLQIYSHKTLDFDYEKYLDELNADISKRLKVKIKSMKKSAIISAITLRKHRKKFSTLCSKIFA